MYANVLRRSCVKAILTLMDGRTVTIKCTGLLARCLQHEVDHLQGGLFTDLVSPEDHEDVYKRQPSALSSITLRYKHPLEWTASCNPETGQISVKRPTEMCIRDRPRTRRQFFSSCALP